MPLKSGKKNIGYNIREMEKAGHPHNQAVAASLHKADSGFYGHMSRESMEAQERSVKMTGAEGMDEEPDFDDK